MTTDELKSMMDKAIGDLVYDKLKLVKAYNYYFGKMDMDQYRHLEENYGIGTPTSIEFIPLVRKHIDVLIGEYLSIPLSPKISCKDKETLSNIFRDKQLTIEAEVKKELSKHLVNAVYSAIQGKFSGINDAQVEREIKELIEGIDRNFVSEYEKAAQNIVQYLIQSRNIDFLNKLKIILTDLLITGTCYYKVAPSPSEENVEFRVLNPIHTFIDRNPNSPYLRDSYRCVIREYMTKDQIFNKYGEYMTKDEIEAFDAMIEPTYDTTNTTYIRTSTKISGEPATDGILGGYEAMPMIPYNRYNMSKFWKLFPVYEIEVLKAKKDKKGFVMTRYEGVRIAHNIYINMGESDNIIRSIDNPRSCTLQVNGMFYSDRNSEPYSLVLSTAALQDKYNLLNFYRDNIIAQSGTKGAHVDLSMLPKFLGDNTPERLMKYLAYRKSGLSVLDSSQEGLTGAPINTIYNGFDDSLQAQSIQAINLVLQQIEETCSSITGVFRERLGDIEQRDAVTNVAVGVKQSGLITKQYYQIMDLITRDVLLDSLNCCKIVYKEGMVGTYILGDRRKKIFTALPEHYTVTDFDIHVANAEDITREEETLKQLAMEFAKGGNVDPDVIMHVITAKGLTEMKDDVLDALNKKKQETGQIQQLQQQLQQMQQQIQQSQQEAEQYKKQFEALDQEKIKLEQDKLSMQRDLGWYNAKAKEEYQNKMIEAQETRNKLEAAQLIDNNPNNDEIKN